MIMKKLITTLLVVIFALEGYSQTANFFQMFSDNLILQRNTSAKIWGDTISRHFRQQLGAAAGRLREGSGLG